MAITQQLNTISSPCIRNCCLNQQDYCLGCYRHLDEIVAWRSYSEEQRLAIMAECRELKLARAELKQKTGQ